MVDFICFHNARAKASQRRRVVGNQGQGLRVGFPRRLPGPLAHASLQREQGYFFGVGFEGGADSLLGLLVLGELGELFHEALECGQVGGIAEIQLGVLDGLDGEFGALVGGQQPRLFGHRHGLVAVDRSQPLQHPGRQGVTARAVCDPRGEDQGLGVPRARTQVAAEGVQCQRILAAHRLQLREGQAGPREAGMGAQRLAVLRHGAREITQGFRGLSRQEAPGGVVGPEADAGGEGLEGVGWFTLCEEDPSQD